MLPHFWTKGNSGATIRSPSRNRLRRCPRNPTGFVGYAAQAQPCEGQGYFGTPRKVSCALNDPEVVISAETGECGARKQLGKYFPASIIPGESVGRNSSLPDSNSVPRPSVPQSTLLHRCSDTAPTQMPSPACAGHTQTVRGTGMVVRCTRQEPTFLLGHVLFPSAFAVPNQ